MCDHIHLLIVDSDILNPLYSVVFMWYRVSGTNAQRERKGIECVNPVCCFLMNRSKHGAMV